MTGLPTADQVLALSAELTLVVPPEFEDDNGHMNISHYFALHSRAMGGLFARLGYAPGPERRVGPFTLEQHLRYHREILVGHEVSVHLRLVGRSDRLVHGMSFLVDRTAGRVANTLELMVGNVDLETRRLAAYDPEAADVLDRTIAEHARLDWDVPRPGPVGLRQRVVG